MYLVSGATGNIGGQVVRALIDAGAGVRALTRQPSEGIPGDAEQVSGDLSDPGSLGSALEGVRGVFFLPGYDDMPGLMSAARAAGAERVVQLSGRSAADGDMTNAISAYMIRSEQAARDSGLAWTIVRPSAFFSNTFQWLPQLADGDVVRQPFAEVPVANIDPYDIGNVVATALTGDAHDGAVYELSGPQALLPADRLRVLGQALHRDLRLEPLSNDEARAELLATTPQQYVDAFFRFYVDGTLDESPVLPTVRQVTGRQPRTFETWVRENVSAFRPSSA